MRRWLVAAAACVVLGACPEPTEPPPFEGLVSLAAHQSCPPYLANCIASYPAEFDRAMGAGANAAQVVVQWQMAERANPDTAGACTPAFMDLWFTNSGYGLEALHDRGLTVLLGMPALETSGPNLPCDLRPTNPPAQGCWGVDWAGEVSTRYIELFDHVLPFLDGNVRYLSIGNEVDFYLGECPAERPGFAAFVSKVAAHVHAVAPELSLGVTTTAQALLGSDSSYFLGLNQSTDVIILTYYNATGTRAVSPTTVSADMDALVARAAGKPLVFQEFGYPSSSISGIGSSEALQAEFFREGFKAWRRLGADAIPYLSVFKMRDWDLAFCRNYGGFAVPETFAQYLCSLGVTNNDGTPKAAWQVIVDEIQDFD